MDTLARAAEIRIREGFEHRMAALRRWFYGEEGEGVCPCCFNTWISVKFTDGWESLHCCECGADGPLPLREVVRSTNKAKLLRAKTRSTRSQTPKYTPLPKRRSIHMSRAAL